MDLSCISFTFYITEHHMKIIQHLKLLKAKLYTESIYALVSIDPSLCGQIGDRPMLWVYFTMSG